MIQPGNKGGALRARMDEARQSVSVFWNARNKRERAMLAAGIAVVVLGLFYALLIDPALGGRKELERRLPTLRQQAAEVQALAREAQNMKNAVRPAAPLTREGMESLLGAKGLKAQNLAVNGEMVKVQFKGASFSSIIAWLADIQRSARVTVVDAVVEAQAQPDMVNANMTLRQPRGEQNQ